MGFFYIHLKTLTKSKQIVYLIYEVYGRIIVIGIVFVKKTQKTPKETIKLAEKRLKEV